MILTANKHNALLDKFLTCINETRFYDAHEAIETIWFKRRFEDCDEMRLLKGFINSAVSFELRKRGRVSQSKRVWQNYLKYRPLLDTINSVHVDKYHHIALHVETLHKRYIS